jgi:hypothetical protein
MCPLVKCKFRQRKSRLWQNGQCLRRRGSQFHAILQLPRQVHSPLIDLTALLTDLLRKSQPEMITLTHAYRLEAFETLKLRLIPAPWAPAGGVAAAAWRGCAQRPVGTYLYLHVVGVGGTM